MESSASTTWLEWSEDGPRRARFQSEHGAPKPTSVRIVDDRLSAAVALRRLRAGESLLYRGDYRNARQLLDALGRRLKSHVRSQPTSSLKDAFRAERSTRLREATTLSRLLVVLDGDYRLELRHAPDVRQACEHALGKTSGDSTVLSLRELLGILGAEQWRQNGLWIPALGAKIYPHYGVFSPTRSEYVDLVAEAPLRPRQRVLEVGTGTGVLACLLAKRGAAFVRATDVDPRAVVCARENAARLGFSDRIEVERADLFPPGTERFDCVLFNPPWIPEAPKTPLDRAIYDPGGQILARFLREAPARLLPDGEVWLVVSDLAERLELRPQGALEQAFLDAGLTVVEKRSVPPKHGKAQDSSDPLHAARSEEKTSLFRLRAK